MTGRTNYTGVANTDPMLGPEQITDVYEHFDPLIGESVLAPANLPTTGNWIGRTIYVRQGDYSTFWNGTTWAGAAPRIRSRVQGTYNGTGGLWNPGSQETIATQTFVIPQGATGTLRAHFGSTLGTSAVTNWAGNQTLYDGATMIRSKRFHNHAHVAFGQFQVIEDGYNLDPGTHIITMRRDVDTTSVTLESWDGEWGMSVSY